MKVEVEQFKQALMNATEAVDAANKIIEENGGMAAMSKLPAAQKRFAELEVFDDPKTLTASIQSESKEDQEELRMAINTLFQGINDVKKAVPMVATMLELEQPAWFDNLEQVKKSLEKKSKKVGPTEEGGTV